MKKDFKFTILKNNYIIRNVPYEIFDIEDEEVMNLDVAVKLEMIRELMLMNEIPHDVNYDDVADLKL